MHKIVTLTVNPALDIYTTTESLEPEKKLRCAPASKDPGGGGVNVSRVLKRLGSASNTIYTRGGYTGGIFSELLSKEEIDQDAVEIKTDLRQNFAVTETSTGNLFRFGFPGAAMEEKEYKRVLDKIRALTDVEFLIASGSLPPDAPKGFYSEVAAIAKELKIKLIVDTSGEPLLEVLKVGAYLIKPNKDELQDLTGKKATNQKEQEVLLREVLHSYPVEIIVLSLGPKGAILATKNAIKHYPAPKVEFVSSIGAGDSMVAGIVHNLSRGETIEKAVLYGLACGSATIKSPGTELLTKADVETLYKVLLRTVER